MRAFGSLRRQGEFTRLYRRGRRFTQSALVLYAYSDPRSARGPRVGISVAKAVGKAVRRNLVRRRIQNAFDSIGLAHRTGLDLLVVARPGAAEMSYDAFFGQLQAALETALRIMLR